MERKYRIPSVVKAEKDMEKYILRTIEMRNKWGDKLDLLSLMEATIDKMYRAGKISKEIYIEMNGKNRAILQDESDLEQSAGSTVESEVD